MVKRLRKRPIHPNMKKMEKLKNKTSNEKTEVGKIKEEPKVELETNGESNTVQEN